MSLICDTQMKRLGAFSLKNSVLAFVYDARLYRLGSATLLEYYDVDDFVAAKAPLVKMRQPNSTGGMQSLQYQSFKVNKKQ